MRATAALRHLCRLGWGLALGAALVPAVGQAAGVVPDGEACLEAAARLEREVGTAPGLLAAIAMVESGYRPQAGAPHRPWPWTINADGQAYYFGSRAEAIAAVQRLMGQGMTNIDIGCMQVSLHWHNTQFTTLEEIFDPATNVAYAARYLSDLRAVHGSWQAAAGRYHSGDPARQAAYLRKVMAHWQGDARSVAVAEEEAAPDDGLARAAAAFAAGRLGEAADLYRARLADNPDDRAARLGYAISLERSGRTEAALAAWRGVLARDPANAQALNRLLAHARRLPPQAALAEARSLRRLAPQAAGPVALMGELLAAGGQAAAAVAAFRQAVALEPTVATHYLNAAIVLDRQGRAREAVDLYRRFLDRQRGNPVALNVSAQEVRRRVLHLQGRL